MLVKARFFVAFGLLLQLLQTTTSTKAAPLQTLDSLLSDIQILAYDLDAAQSQNLQHQNQNNPPVQSNFRPNRSKRHIFSNWFLQHQRRSVINNKHPRNSGGVSIAHQSRDQTRPDKSEQEYQDKSEEQDQQQPDTKLDELNLAIRKLQLWEFALQRRFGDRFKNAPHKLAAHPLWQKVMQLRQMLHRLMAMAEANRAKMQDTRGLDTTRMKK